MERKDSYKAIYLLDASADVIEPLDAALAHYEQHQGAYGFLSPSSTYHRFMTGLTGGKMSSSQPESAIFLTDTPDVARKKIMSAKTGGAVSLSEHKKFGGRPEDCVVYELLLYHLMDNDQELADLYTRCTGGQQRCGDCKKMVADQMASLLIDLQEKRKGALEQIQEYVAPVSST